MFTPGSFNWNSMTTSGAQQYGMPSNLVSSMQQQGVSPNLVQNGGIAWTGSTRGETEVIAGLQNYIRDLIFSRDSDTIKFQKDKEALLKTVQELQNKLAHNQDDLRSQEALAESAVSRQTAADSEKETAQAEASKLRNQLADLIQKNESLKIQKMKSDEMINVLRGQVETLLEEMDELNSKVEDAKRESQEEISRLRRETEAEKEDFRLLLENARVDRAKLASGLSSKVAEEKRMKEMIEEYASQAKVLKSQLLMTESTLIEEQLKLCCLQYEWREATMKGYIHELENSSLVDKHEQIDRFKMQLVSDQLERGRMEANARAELAKVSVGQARESATNNNTMQPPSVLSVAALTNGLPISISPLTSTTPSLGIGGRASASPAPVSVPTTQSPVPALSSSRTPEPSAAAKEKRAKLDHLVSLLQNEVPSLSVDQIRTHIEEFHRLNNTTFRGLSSADVIAYVKSKVQQKQPATARTKPVKKMGLIDDDFDLPLRVEPAPSNSMSSTSSSSASFQKIVVTKKGSEPERTNYVRPRVPVLKEETKSSSASAPAKPAGPPKGWNVVREQTEWGGHDENTCSICISDMSHNNRQVLSCKHAYHVQCIRKWFEKESSCPICRKYVVETRDFPEL